MNILSLILSLIAGCLSVFVVLSTIREHARFIALMLTQKSYTWEENRINSVFALIAVALWIIVAHLN